LRAVLLRRGARIDLTGMTSARDLNLHRVVTGLGASGDQFHALIWKRGELIDLGTLPGGDFSAGRSINDRAQVVGESTVGSNHGFLWEDGVMAPLQDLVPGFAFASDINNRGQIVGNSASNPNVVGGDPHAVLWNDRHDMPTDLGTLPGDPLSAAAAINDRGLIVGFSGAGGFNAHAVAWVPDR
jgi:probable HAF family extracellular repeat protein